MILVGAAVLMPVGTHAAPIVDDASKPTSYEKKGALQLDYDAFAENVRLAEPLDKRGCLGKLECVGYDVDYGIGLIESDVDRDGRSEGMPFEDLDAETESSRARGLEALRRYIESLVDLIRILAILGGNLDQIAFNGVYDGVLSSNGTSAEASLDLDHAYADVAGTLFIKDGTMTVDPGVLCTNVTIPASALDFTAVSPAVRHAEGSFTRRISVFGVPTGLVGHYTLDLQSDYETLFAAITIVTPFPCEDVRVTGTFRKRSGTTVL
jgi:hypothetical protein